MNQSNLKNQIILILIFTVIFISGTILIFSIPSTIQKTYSLTMQTKDGVTIYFNVFEPREDLYQATNGEAKKKAIIIGHGHRANKEMLKGYAIEIANAGFVAITFDFRGHGQSGGILERDLLINDVRAIKAYLNSRNDIDIDNLGYIGYSMGGFPGWEIINEDDSFKCFIGIGTGLPSATYSPEFAVKTSSGRKLNVLMILARYDEAVTVERLKEGMALRLGKSVEEIDVNQLYGNFQTGTASMIFLDDNTNHLLLCWDQDFIREARNWIISTFPSIRQTDENFYVNIRGVILLIQLIGGMGLFFSIISPLSDLILTRKKEEENSDLFKIETPDISILNISLKALISLLVIGFVGIIIFLPLTFVLPLSTMAQVIMLLFGQTFAILFLLWRLTKQLNLSMKELLKGPFKNRSKRLREFLLGAILSIILYIIVNISVGLNYFGMEPSVNKFIYIPLYLVIEFFILMVFNIFANSTLQIKFEKGRKGQLKAGFLILGLQLIYMIVFLLFLSYLQGSLFTFGVFMPVVVPITILGSYVSVALYEKTESIIPGTIIATVIIILQTITVSLL